MISCGVVISGEREIISDNGLFKHNAYCFLGSCEIAFEIFVDGVIIYCLRGAWL